MRPKSSFTVVELAFLCHCNKKLFMKKNIRSLITILISMLAGQSLAITPTNPTNNQSKVRKAPHHGKIVCRVADRELQGEFVGNCDDQGFADGYATISGKASYTGQFKKGQKNGFGIKTWSNGDTYAGQFIDDYKEGQGIYRWGKDSVTPGDVYIGAFKQDQRWGLGTYHWSNGDQFSGHWEANKYLGVATPMQHLQFLHNQALADAIKTQGVTVCKNLEPPQPANTVIVGQVANINGDILTINLFKPTLDQNLRPITRVQDHYRNWTPCDPDSVESMSQLAVPASKASDQGTIQ